MAVISFVVDALPQHYYKAELLLFSLLNCAGHTKDEVIVQCVDRVDQHFLAFLKSNGYRYNIIKPFLDGKYCNKIPQLDALADEECDGVFLIDIDMFVLEPLRVDDDAFFWGKIVDGPNPPLSVLQNIFEKAGLSQPEIVDTDWVMLEGKTLATNFNGGFYYIPKTYIADLSARWRRWAEWLYTRPELFESDAQRNHLDQVAMALSVPDGNVPYKSLSSNCNFPTHKDAELRSYQPNVTISVLHYHWLLTPFGTLDKYGITHAAACKAIDAANEAIIKSLNFVYFSAFKKSLLPQVEGTKGGSEFSSKLLRAITTDGDKRTLILHVGTPKTGTTSLQFFMDKNRDELIQQGILYPSLYNNTYAPKHQWIVSRLRADDASGLADDLVSALQGMGENIHTVFLSTEGIYNHWWDFTNASKSTLSELNKFFNVKIWVWFREPVSFAESFYRQNIKNPQLNKVKCYGRDLSFVEMLDDPWFVRHLDYLGFIYECEKLFGRENIKVFPHGGDIIPTACEQLQVKVCKGVDAPRENVGLSVAAIDVLRIVNRYALTMDEKKLALSHVDKLNEILSRYSDERITDEAAIEKVHGINAVIVNELSREYGIEFLRKPTKTVNLDK